MPDWLAISLILAALLVTTFAIVGSVTLWAANSQSHWFLRVGLVLAVLCAPLVIPAYEPVIVFTIESGVILSAVTIWRWRIRRRATLGDSRPASANVNQPRAVRFSLMTLLLLLTLVAILAAIITKAVHQFPLQSFQSLYTLVMIGVAGGCAALLGAWVFVSSRKWIAWPVALVLCTLIAAPVVLLDWLFFSVVVLESWPPEPMLVGAYAALSEGQPALLWFAILPAIVVSTWLLLYLGSLVTMVAATPPDSQPLAMHRRDARQVGAIFLFTAILIVIAMPPSLATWRLMNPRPLPNPAPPLTNGVEDVGAAGRVFGMDPILNTNVEPKSTKELAATISKHSAAFDQLRSGLSHDIRVRNWRPKSDLMSEFDKSIDTMGELRSAARGIMRLAELAQCEGRYADAARASLDNLRLGQEIARDGVLVDWSVGIAIEGVGHSTLYEAVLQLNADECREVISTLTNMERQREPIDAVMSRDRAWSDHANGWSWRFINLLNDIAASDERDSPQGAFLRIQAVARLIMVEAALRRFQLTNSARPERLEQLVPEYLPELPIDPYDPQVRPLRYARAGSGHVVYSVGADRDDDSGRPLARDKDGLIDYQDGDGDIRLDAYLSKHDDTSPTAAAASGDTAVLEPADEQ